MSKIVLKIARRKTSVSRRAVRNAVNGAFVNISSTKKRNNPSSKRAAVGVATSK